MAQGFPALECRPPFHPNCEHVLLPFVEERYDEDELNLYAKMSNDGGYIASTSEWQMARKGAPLRKAPVNFDDPEEAAEAAAQKKRPAAPTRPRWERDRARIRENYKTEDREQSERLVSGLLKRDRDAYPTNRDGKPVFIHKHEGYPNPEELLKDSYTWPKELSDQTASELCSAIGEIFEESKRLGAPGFRALNFDIPPEKIMTCGDGVLGVKANNLEHIRIAKRIPEQAKAKPKNVISLLERKDRVRGCVYHEFAHHIHQQLDVETVADARVRPWEARLRAAWKKSGRGANSVSRNSSVNEREWFADNYALSMLGLQHLVDKNKALSILLDMVIPK